MTKAKSNIDPAVLAAFDTMIECVPGVVRKGATMPYLSMNGNMYASISKANVIGIRLSKHDLEEFLACFDATLFESLPGFFQKEYIAVPASMLSEMELLHDWFRKCHANALSLKPKKTKR